MGMQPAAKIKLESIFLRVDRKVECLCLAETVESNVFEVRSSF